jgi:phosphotriesterase-related protein
MLNSRTEAAVAVVYRRTGALSRREVLGLIGAGAGLHLMPGLLAQGQPAAATFPAGAVIRTVLKDISPGSLSGPMLFHEHLSIDLPPNLNPRPANAPPAPPPQPSPTLNVDLMVDEVNAAARDGVTLIVDGGHPDMNRKLENLKTIATRTGMPIVASGGYYMERTYPAELASKSDDAIADGLVEEAVSQHLGAFGEIGENADAAMSDYERKIFRAVGKAHVKTRLPIFTHNAYGTGPNVPKDAGLRQLDILEGVGVKPDRIVIGHTCCLDDPEAEVIKAIARRGAFVGFDRVTAGRVTDDKKVLMLLKFLDAGYTDHLLLSSDLTGARTLDIPGYSKTVTVFAPKLRAAGVSDAVVRRILVDNPRRFLSFVPAN